MKKLSTDQVADIFRKKLKKEVHLVLNDNRYQLVRIMSVEAKKIRISLHRLFLHAGETLISKIAQKLMDQNPVKNAKIALLFENPPKRKTNKAYISDGEFYRLDQIYQKINKEYFDQKVDLAITWFGSVKRKAKWHRTLGYYDGENKVIKIHRLLDDPFFPPFYLDFIVYHEMLHHVYPPYYSKDGRYMTHHKTFKQQEKKFRQYQLAINWEKKNLNSFFTN
ncbi:MAG: hypothetical protein Tsb0015_04100 [Simkaniaceae bacterium]